jgi:hypothetical protein
MTRSILSFLAAPAFALVFACALVTHAHSASSAASSAAEAGSSAAGSASDSLSKSSQSSGGNNKVAAGQYRVVQMAAANKAGMMALTLAAVEPNQATKEFVLTLPQTAVTKSGLAVGDTVEATAQTYGLKFAAAKTQAPFFLVVDDAVFRELTSSAVSL